jgi:hypoxanthine-DNA glycosylase
LDQRQTLQPIKSSFEPVADLRTRVLILGALPGQISLERRQYYANPTNQFWRLMERVVEADLVREPYEARLDALLNAGVGLWDVVKSARRAGSLDADIRDASPNRLRPMAANLPGLRAMAFNGGKAFSMGRREMGPEASCELLALPSSSAAYCAASFERKLGAWSQLKRFLRRG